MWIWGGVTIRPVTVSDKAVQSLPLGLCSRLCADGAGRGLVSGRAAVGHF